MTIIIQIILTIIISKNLPYQFDNLDGNYSKKECRTKKFGTTSDKSHLKILPKKRPRFLQ